MQTNETPHYDASDNATGCCPRFKPEGWDQQRLHFEGKRFARAQTRSFFHIPLNMGSVFSKLQRAIDAAGATDMGQYLVLSEELSAWKAQHLVAVTKDVPGYETLGMDGDYLTKVFEGPYYKAQQWCDTLKAEAEKLGRTAGRVLYFYTTCPKCSKAYGENYVVGLVELK
jgi:hypothetical protein